MTQKELLTRLLSTTFTRADLHRRTRILREAAEQILFTTQKEKMKDTQTLLTQLGASGEDIACLLPIVSHLSQEPAATHIYKEINSIEDTINSIPKITIYIATHLDQVEKDALGRWFRTHVAETALLEIDVDPTLIGGIAFVKNGAYYDYSIRATWEKEKIRMTELLNQYEKVHAGEHTQ